MVKIFFFILLFAGVTVIDSTAKAAEKPHIVVQSTTSTQNSGLYDYLLPKFTLDTGIEVHVVAVGTGAAVRNAMNCDGDVLLVHSQQREKAFVAEGYAPRRYALMYNDFVIIGPASDPAGLAGKQDAVDALQAMAATKIPFYFARG